MQWFAIEYPLFIVVYNISGLLYTRSNLLHCPYDRVVGHPMARTVHLYRLSPVYERRLSFALCSASSAVWSDEPRATCMMAGVYALSLPNQRGRRKGARRIAIQPHAFMPFLAIPRLLLSFPFCLVLSFAYPCCPWHTAAWLCMAMGVNGS